MTRTSETTAATACISTPVSWLTLERYALGELGELGASSDDVRAHLDACAACAACLAQVEAEATTELRPLARAPEAKRARPRPVLAVVTGLAMAAAAVLAVGRWSSGPGPDVRSDGRGEGDRVKSTMNGAVAFTLVRDDETIFAEAGGTFRGGDRFKVLVTCPPGARASFDLVVYDAASERASFPLPAATSLECGNEVPLTGAFRMTGTDAAHVCLVWNDTGVDRAAVSALTWQQAAALGACKVLTAAP